MTPVAFRRLRNGKIVAIFPTVPASPNPDECLMHTAVDEPTTCVPLDLVRSTDIVWEDEAKRMLDALKGEYPDSDLRYSQFAYTQSTERTRRESFATLAAAAAIINKETKQ